MKTFVMLAITAGWWLLSGTASSFAASDEAPFAGRSTPDRRVRDYILPARVLWQSPPEGCAVRDAEFLLRPFNGQISLADPSGCILNNNGKAPGILLDFGRELQGGIQLAVAGLLPSSGQSKNAHVRIRFGESAAEAMSELGGEANAASDYSVRDETPLLPRFGTVEFGNTGFRFIRIDLVESNSFVVLKAVRAVFVHSDLPALGSFRCNDERLNRIWAAGAYTVFLNMQDYVWDGIKRDRLVWAGDLHPETSTIGAVFGNVPVVPASLDFVRLETPLPNWMNGFSSYSLWWLIIQRDWYLQNGDLAYLRQQQAYFTGLLRQMKKHIGPDGAETLPGTRFLDWPSSYNKKVIHAGLQALMVLAFEAGGEMAAALGDSATAVECAEAVTCLRKHLPEHGNSKSAAALMVLAGLGDAARFNREVMGVDGAKRMTTFTGYYVLQARAKADDYQGCLDNIRDFWGAMLDLGATTFWEDFDLDWLPNAARIDELVPPGRKDIHGAGGAYTYKGFRQSLCHGWASGPTAWLSQHVLGVQVVEAGCKTVRIVPHLGDLQWAEGCFPTPNGVIKIRHEKQADGTIKSDIQAPPGVRVESAAK